MLRAWNELGGALFDETSYAGNYVGSFNTGGAQTGSITDPAMIGKRLIYFVPQALSVYGGPDLILNSATGQITWQYNVQFSNQVPSPPPAEDIDYGGY